VSRRTVLIVEDERDIAELVAYSLAREGYETSISPSSEEALSAIGKALPDLVVLDIMLPGASGLELCRKLKRDPERRNIPIVMLTARSQDSDIVAGLEAGADDYVTKPFSPRVLVARIRAVTRRLVDREEAAEALRIEVHGLVIDIPRHEASWDGMALELSATEFDLLTLFARSPGRVFSREQIISAIKGQDYPVTERSVDVQVVGLRRKLGNAADIIQTVRGVGYRMRKASAGAEP
jgi:two-component system alkaline phosphatase synthesis response regulator PhoP